MEEAKPTHQGKKNKDGGKEVKKSGESDSDAEEEAVSEFMYLPAFQRILHLSSLAKDKNVRR